VSSARLLVCAMALAFAASCTQSVQPKPSPSRDVDAAPKLARDAGAILLQFSAYDYGLAGAIWTENLRRAHRMIPRVRAGTIWVNKHLDLPFDVPFRGAKQSGLGAENGLEGLEEYTQAKIINVAL